jgi:hypothetical protein
LSARQFRRQPPVAVAATADVRMGDAMATRGYPRRGLHAERWHTPLDAMTTPERLALDVCEP